MSVVVVGLVAGVHVIEDIRVEVPYRIAVTISDIDAVRSRDLDVSIQTKKVLRVQGALPQGVVMSRGVAVPRSGTPRTPKRPPPQSTVESQIKTENVRLLRELEDSKAREQNLLKRIDGLQALNQGLQTTLSGQLTSIQGVLEALEKRGIQVTSFPGGSPGVSSSEVDGAAPLFLTSVKTDAAKVNITVKDTEKTSSDGLAASRQALANLKKKPS